MAAMRIPPTALCVIDLLAQATRPFFPIETANP
jgi:hypothetical protein